MPLIYNLSYLLKILESLVFILSPNIQWKFQLIYIFSNIETETKIPLPSKVLLLLLFSQQVMSASLQLHDCSTPGFPTLSPGVCSNSCLLSRWWHPTISASVLPFSSCLQSLPESGFFPTSWFFASGGQIIRASASASVLPMNIWGWFPLGLSGFISLLPKGLSRVFSSTTVWKHQLSKAQTPLWPNWPHHCGQLDIRDHRAPSGQPAVCQIFDLDPVWEHHWVSLSFSFLVYPWRQEQPSVFFQGRGEGRWGSVEKALQAKPQTWYMGIWISWQRRL